MALSSRCLAEAPCCAATSLQRHSNSCALPAARSSTGLALLRQPSAAARGGLLRASVGVAPPQGRSSARSAQAAYAEESTLPDGYVWYETMIVLRPDLSDQERDAELAKFEAFLNKEECKEVDARIKGRQSLAYPMKGYWEGLYVLYRYGARRRVSQQVQKLLSAPSATAETNILRHMTFCL